MAMSSAPRFYCNNCGHLNYLQGVKQGGPPLMLHCEECCFLQRELPSSLIGSVKRVVKYDGKDFADECEWPGCNRQPDDSFPPPGPRHWDVEGLAAWVLDS